jgi:catechol 2,3-dioxygenase-like lactoylglutathione lyase family enzyme
VNELSLIIDHVSLSVEDLGRAKNFYSRALAPLGMQIVGEVTAEQSGSVGFVGFGIGRKGSFWVAHNGRQNPTAHICFRAPTRAAVRDFHAAGRFRRFPKRALLCFPAAVRFMRLALSCKVVLLVERSASVLCGGHRPGRGALTTARAPRQCYTVSGQICVTSDTLAAPRYSFCARVPERCANTPECALLW